MAGPQDDLAAYLASPDGQAQRTPVKRSYEVFIGIGTVKTVNDDGTVALTYNGGNGDGTTSGLGPGLPAGCVSGYAPAVGDTVLVYLLGEQLWVNGINNIGIPTSWVGIAGGVGYASGWADTGSPFPVGGYRRVGDVVELRGGVISSNSPTSTIFTLPSGYRPPGTVGFPTAGSAAYAQVNVLSTGVVELVAGSAASDMHLDGIRFSVAP